jgi:hypothetical protein
MASPESRSLTDKKVSVEQHELSSLSEKGLDGTPIAAAAPYDQKATKRLLRKMDLYLIPFLALLYL